MSQSNQSASTGNASTQGKKVALPMWASFAKAIASRIENANIEVLRDRETDSGLPENNNWVRIEDKRSGNKIYVPKGKTQIRHLETTIELKPDPQRGVLPLPQPKSGRPYTNGLIRSHLAPDPEKAASLFIEAIESGATKPAKRAPRTIQQQPASGHETMAVDRGDVGQVEVSDAELTLASAQEDMAEAEATQQSVGQGTR